MDDELKLMKQRDLGNRARTLRENELLKSILEGLKSQYIREWASTDLADEKLREHKYLQLHALMDFWARLNSLINDGKAASAFLDHEAKVKGAA